MKEVPMFLKRFVAVPLVLVLVSACGEGTTAVSPTDSAPAFAKDTDHFDMVDDFSGSGASGDGNATVQQGHLNLNIRANDLIPDHAYEVHVIVGPPDVMDLVLPPANLHVFSVTADKNGKVRFNIARLDLGIAPGPQAVYRLDYVIVHDLGAAHTHTADETNLFTSLVLACLPASFFTI